VVNKALFKGTSAMPRFKVAHIKHQGVDLIIIPLESSFGHKPDSDQQSIITDLQIHSRAAGLAGTVVPVWDAGGGRMSFIAPQNWHPYFSSISLAFVWSNVNREIYW
jgi:hypothetical protein